jgi:hypothetical protein
VIDKWRIRNSIGVTVEIPIRLRYVQDKIEFSAVYEGGPVFNFTDIDINVLRQKVKNHCDKIVQPWTPKLHVNVTSSAEEYGGTRATSLRIAYSEIEVNCDSEGKPIKRDKGSSHIIKDAPSEGADGDDEMYALIDNTPENRAKLDNIIAALCALSLRVLELMSPDKILTTIKNSDRLLPAPGGKQK